MSSTAHEKVTQLLARAREGDRQAASEVYEQLYGELRKIAQRLFAQELPGSTLQATVLVNEAWLKLREEDGRLNVPEMESRLHFYRVAATVMREILVDHARGKKAAKRGGGQVRVSIDDRDLVDGPGNAEVLALDEALGRLAVRHPRAAQVVELRYFAGSTIPETAAALGISPETVKKDWRFARAWLRLELQNDG